MDLAPNLLVTLIMNNSLKLSRPQFSHPQYILVKSESDSVLEMEIHLNRRNRLRS